MMMWWRWFSSLFPHRKQQDIDPYQWKCTCGYVWKFGKLELLYMHLFDDYTHTCPQCQRQSRYRMISHVVRETDTQKIRENNKILEDIING